MVGSGNAPADAPPAGSAAVMPDAAAAAASQEPAEPRARALLEAQLATFPDKHDALAATFTPKAFVLVPTVREAADTSNELATLIPGMEGHEEKLVSRKIDKLVAGSSRGITWLGAELLLEIKRPSGTIKKPMRVLELLDGNSGAKVAVASFGNVTKQLYAQGDMGTLPETSNAGPLAKLLTSPGDAAAALANDPNVIVMGTDATERAVGYDAAKKMLESWKVLKLSIDKSNVLEVHTADWGYALAYVNMPSKDPQPYRMTALIIGIPKGDSWSVVGMHYLPI